MILIELNEFNPELLLQAARELGLINIGKLLSGERSETRAIENKERYGLDPWVQWVSIHTGKSSEYHRIKHLGDVTDLKTPQLWETLSKYGISSGIWGAMNATRGTAENCKFFIPDPWTFSEKAHPNELNYFLAFPRYYAQNYGKLNFLLLCNYFLKFLAFVLKPRIIKALLPIAPKLTKLLIKYKFSNHLLFAVFDLINVKIFAEYHKRYHPDFSLIFLNSIAHLQHHKWKSQNTISDEMGQVFRLLDETVQVLLDLSEGKYLVANAFRQIHSYSDNEYLYRPKDPNQFLIESGLFFLNVEQAMTNDGNIFFPDELSADNGREILEASLLDGEKAFHVDPNNNDSKRIFYQFIIWKDISSNAILYINGKAIKFYDFFEKITRRSGKHVEYGDIYSNGMSLPGQLINCELHDYLLSHLLVENKAKNSLC